MKGMREYSEWLADPTKTAERAAYFNAPQEPRADWPVDTRDLIQRYTEIGNMALQWAVENFKLAEEAAVMQ